MPLRRTWRKLIAFLRRQYQKLGQPLRSMPSSATWANGGLGFFQVQRSKADNVAQVVFKPTLAHTRLPPHLAHVAWTASSSSRVCKCCVALLGMHALCATKYWT